MNKISSSPTGQETTGALYCRSNYELAVLLFYQLFNKLCKYARSYLIQRNKRDDCQNINSRATYVDYNFGYNSELCLSLSAVLTDFVEGALNIFQI